MHTLYITRILLVVNDDEGNKVRLGFLFFSFTQPRLLSTVFLGWGELRLSELTEGPALPLAGHLPGGEGLAQAEATAPGRVVGGHHTEGGRRADKTQVHSGRSGQRLSSLSLPFSGRLQSFRRFWMEASLSV